MMFLFPNAKINIGLNIKKKLKSGYHEIESCFCPISLHDIIEIKESNENKLSLSGININTPKKNNIIKKALELSESQKKYKIHLHKKIPIGGGLGGGSSDAAFLLKFLYDKHDISNQDLRNKAKEIGADCPFFIENSMKFITGVGEKMENINIDIKDKIILVIDPEEGISTKEAYDNIIPESPKYDLKKILENENIENWKKYIKNSFEDFAMNKINDLNKIKKYLYNEGAKYVSLTGSGSCIYGIFEKKNISTKNLKYNTFLVNPIM